MKEKLTAENLNNYLWEALEDFRAGNITKAELNALTNTAGKMVQVAMMDILSKNSITCSDDLKRLN